MNRVLISVSLLLLFGASACALSEGDECYWMADCPTHLVCARVGDMDRINSIYGMYTNQCLHLDVWVKKANKHCIKNGLQKKTRGESYPIFHDWGSSRTEIIYDCGEFEKSKSRPEYETAEEYHDKVPWHEYISSRLPGI